MNTNSVQERQADNLVINNESANGEASTIPKDELRSFFADPPVSSPSPPMEERAGERRLSEIPALPHDGPALLDALTRIFARYVVLPKWAAETLALWTVHTYAFELRDVSTYLGLESPEKRCGKTTLLGILSKLVNRPVVAANISPSAFFRVIEKVRPTLLIDEADTILQGNDELRGILNAGYKKDTAYVIRAQKTGPLDNETTGPQDGGTSCRRRHAAADPRSFSGDPLAFASSPLIPIIPIIPILPISSEDPSASPPSLPVEERVGERRHNHNIQEPAIPLDNARWEGFQRYSCWCPKVMAAIGRLPDTLADRCIVIRMQRKRWDEQCGRLRDLDTADLTQRCAAFVRRHAKAISTARPQVPDVLHDRAADIWEPLFILADLAGGDWPQKARQAAVGLTAITQEHNPSSSFLFDLFFIFMVNKEPRMFTLDLVDWLNSARFAQRPWREARKGKPVTDIWLAQQLRPYGVRPKTFRVEEKLGKGYLQEDLIEVCRRYVPQSEVENWKAENPPAEPEPPKTRSCQKGDGASENDE